MDRSELIRAVGHIMDEVSVQLGSMSPSLPAYAVLEEKRDQLDAQQLRLVKLQLKESTEAYKSLTKSFEDTNKKLTAAIKDIERIVETVDGLTKIIKIVDNFLLLAASVVA